MDYVIFSIDGINDLHQKAKFLRHLDTARAMGKMKGNLIFCIGSWQGLLEESYLLSRVDFDSLVLNSGYVDKQQQFLYVANSGSTYANDEEGFFFVGIMDQVAKEELDNYPGWTYRPDLNIYWTVKEKHNGLVN